MTRDAVARFSASGSPVLTSCALFRFLNTLPISGQGVSAVSNLVHLQPQTAWIWLMTFSASQTMPCRRYKMFSQFLLSFLHLCSLEHLMALAVTALLCPTVLCWLGFERSLFACCLVGRDIVKVGRRLLGIWAVITFFFFYSSFFFFNKLGQEGPGNGQNDAILFFHLMTCIYAGQNRPD